LMKSNSQPKRFPMFFLKHELASYISDILETKQFLLTVSLVLCIIKSSGMRKWQTE
jgi:hypothetical protein